MPRRTRKPGSKQQRKRAVPKLSKRTLPVKEIIRLMGIAKKRGWKSA